MWKGRRGKLITTVFNGPLVVSNRRDGGQILDEGSLNEVVWVSHILVLEFANSGTGHECSLMRSQVRYFIAPRLLLPRPVKWSRNPPLIGRISAFVFKRS
jgi:hypothetical protein